MAFAISEKYVSQSGPGPGLMYTATSAQPKTFAQGTITLAMLTPVAFNTSTNFWSIYQHGGANGTGTIRGFLINEPLVLAASAEVIGVVMLTGRIHIDAIPIVTGYTRAQLEAAVATIKDQGIIIEGLASFR